MAYQALYRKWRPRTFDGVVGQTAITDTLKNAIKRGKISHAFLFAGPRGTGKTSCAKIFAKALNCTNLQDGEPCNECENCLAADKGTMNDIIEIDAASNNGVDEIRDIRDKVKYAPTQGKYKVYIIDEVHMLSMGAFNALLKTLEEPPEHVVFILATTELQKVPATIISRTQRYNFKRIDQHDLIARMTYILGQEKIDFEEKALEVIAQVADGGMRDSLSILDQILSYDQDKVKYDDALKITGYAAQEKIEQVLLDLLKGQTSEAFEIVHNLLQDGASTKNILDELISLTVKGMLVVKSNKEATFLTKDYATELAKIPEEKFYNLVQAANTALNDLRYTNQQQIPLDVFVVQVTQAAGEKAPVEQGDAVSSAVVQKLKSEIDSLSKQVAELKNRPVQATRRISSDFSGTIKTETNSHPKKVVDQAADTEQKPKRRKASANNQAAQENNRRQVYHLSLIHI